MSEYTETSSIDEVWEALDAGKRVEVFIDGEWHDVIESEWGLWNTHDGVLFARRDYKFRIWEESK